MLTTGEIIQSPLNYTGGKYRLLPQLLPWFPNDIETFVDLMCGGCNVGLNIQAQEYVYNDNNEKLIGLYNTLAGVESFHFLDLVYEIIDKYGLSLVSERGYEFYGCKSGNGLSAYNKENYTMLRKDFNKSNSTDERYYAMLYVLIVYGFNNQIRFNRRNEYNLPVGKRDFNEKMKLKLISFMDTIKRQKARFLNSDFRNFDYNSLGASDFVYIDPPYLITCASYNEQDGWNEQCEVELLEVLDNMNSKGIRFALSNVVESKGAANEILLHWLSNRNYQLIELNYNYRNANYHRKAKESVTKEVLVTNYGRRR